VPLKVTENFQRVPLREKSSLNTDLTYFAYSFIMRVSLESYASCQNRGCGNYSLRMRLGRGICSRAKDGGKFTNLKNNGGAEGYLKD
jgi:hypothetical protein